MGWRIDIVPAACLMSLVVRTYTRSSPDGIHLVTLPARVEGRGISVMNPHSKPTAFSL